MMSQSVGHDWATDTFTSFEFTVSFLDEHNYGSHLTDKGGSAHRGSVDHPNF